MSYLEQEKAASFGAGHRTGFRLGRGYEQLDAAHRAELSRPYPGNPPELLKQTVVRVLRRFQLAGGQIAEPGSIVTVDADTAKSMLALGKAEIVD
jgi:hypothetical protein